jgi:hypothetical protein
MIPRASRRGGGGGGEMKLWCIANILQAYHQECSTQNLGAAEELLNFFCRLLKDLITDFRVQGNNNNSNRRRRRREHRVARTWLSDHSFFWVRVRDRE